MDKSCAPRQPEKKIPRNSLEPSVQVGLDCGESMTKQSFQGECDINVIMSRFEKTGQLPEMIKNNPQYGDFADVPSYQESLNIVSLAHEQFNALSARVRSRFENDPAQFLAFASDPRNQKELVAMGLATERATLPQDQSKAGSEGKTPLPASPAPQASNKAASSG